MMASGLRDVKRVLGEIPSVVVISRAAERKAIRGLVVFCDEMLERIEEFHFGLKPAHRLKGTLRAGFAADGRFALHADELRDAVAEEGMIVHDEQTLRLGVIYPPRD